MGSAIVFVCARGRGDAKDARDRGTRATRRATGRDRSAPLAHVASRACHSLAAVARRSAADVRRHVGRRRSARRSERPRSRTRVALAYASKKLGRFFPRPPPSPARRQTLTDRTPPSERVPFLNRSRGGKAGYVYKLGLRNGKANIDEYAPIYTPEEFKTDGDKYEGDLKLAALAIVGVVGTGALAILLTSAL
jgi:hypothetical protein